MSFSSTQFSDNVGTVASATVSPANTTLLVGGTQQLTVTARDASGNVLSGRTVFFLSSSPGTATVSTTGLVTSVATGSVTITATIEGVAATAVITSIGAPGTAGNLLTSNGTAWTSVTPAGGGDPKVLFKCFGWSGSSAVIPAADYGSYSRYEITGGVACWPSYCSTLSFGFGGGPSGSTLVAGCCTQMSCGIIQDKFCNYSTSFYSCAGSIPWPFGCGSDKWTACSVFGWQFKINVVPYTTSCAFYETETFTSGGNICCNGIRNSGYLVPCCAADPRCLRGVCITGAGSETQNIGAGATITITGFGRLV